MDKSLFQNVLNGTTGLLQSDLRQERQHHVPLVIPDDADGAGRVRSPRNGPLIENLAQREAVLSGVFHIHKVFKHARLVSKIRGFTEKRVFCSEYNKFSV